MNIAICLSPLSQFPRCTQLVCILCFLSGDVTAQFIAAPPTCHGDTFTFRCTVTGDMSGYTVWRVGRSSACIFSLSTVGAVSTCGPGSTLTARSGTGFGTSATFFSSTLSGTATPELNGTLVECFGPGLARDAGNRAGSSTLRILGQ